MLNFNINIIGLIAFIMLCNGEALHGQENTSILCSDGIDNDGDGLIDCDDQECSSLGDSGCQRCEDGSSFADVVIEYISGCPQSDQNPEGALGVSDYDGNNDIFRVFLGEGGSIKLGFTNNLIVNSGDPDEDIFVFEVGYDVEPMDVALRPVDGFTSDQLILFGFSDVDGDGFFEILQIGGAVAGIDIDGFLPDYAPLALKFDAIELTDVINDDCGGVTPGADIDAVCALTNIVVDCAGTINGPLVLDECGNCLEPDDPDFNVSCTDCAGVVNGISEIDICGLCLETTDPNFDQSCVDCAGVMFGTMVLDECGNCLEPDDPAFNVSCTDCAGVVNGLSIIDQCGDCFEPDDPNFNASCSDCAGVINGEMIMDTCGICLDLADPLFNISCVEFEDVFIPNVFTPNGDGSNDVFQIFHPDGVSQINQYSIFNRWGDLIYIQQNFELASNGHWWDGRYKDVDQDIQIFIYIIEVTFINGKTRQYSGDVLLLK